ncbi:MAG: 30S ribosome-binding factor RbfA [Bilifractor sp.]|nr:30S ribosome-binding factor RbfA [Lachnospiraceae bacterium]MDY2838498.1 30S ribosome-binding factor RbfA [Bilifractor sp.]
MRKNSVKNIRINESVKEELSNIIRNEVKDPRIAPVVSVTEAIVATDLKTCKVMISVLGDEKAKEDTMEGLKSSSGFIRHMLAVNLNLRNTPELHFKLDESIEYGVQMSKRIDEVMEQDRRGKHAEEN